MSFVVNEAKGCLLISIVLIQAAASILFTKHFKGGVSRHIHFTIYLSIYVDYDS
jgi:hypothetical protein